MSVMHGTGGEPKITRLDDNFGGGETKGAGVGSGMAKPASKGGETRTGKYQETPEAHMLSVCVFEDVVRDIADSLDTQTRLEKDSLISQLAPPTGRRPRRQRRRRWASKQLKIESRSSSKLPSYKAKVQSSSSFVYKAPSPSQHSTTHGSSQKSSARRSRTQSFSLASQYSEPTSIPAPTISSRRYTLHSQCMMVQKARRLAFGLIGSTAVHVFGPLLAQDVVN